MSQPGIHFQLLLPASVDQLLNRPVGKLTPVSGPESEPTPFTALDYFDQPLRLAGKLLLDTNGHFELLGDNQPTQRQLSAGSPRFINDFAPGAVQRALAGLSPLRKLLPIGSGTQRHTTLTFVDDEGKTHCRAKLISFNTDEGRSVSVVELQGVRGYGKSLSQLQLHLGRMGGALAGIGALYKQLFPTLPAYEAKPDVLISNDETAFQAANKIIASCLPIARANEAGIIADHDTEFLHDYRVQLRKIRSVLSLFKGVYETDQTVELKSRFADLARPTGRLRDLDVYLLEKSAYRDLVPQSLRSGLDTLFDLFSQEREIEQQALSQHLSSTAYTREITRLAKLFKRPKELKRGEHADQDAHGYACERIWQQYRKVRKAALVIGPDTPDEEIHDLRIRCKKLRYLIEFFNPIFPQAGLKKVLKPLKQLQENLGLFNDYSVQQESLHAFLQALPERKQGSDLQVAQSVGALIAVLHGRQLEEREKVLLGLVRFNRPAVQETFRDLFQNLKDDT